MTDTDRLQFRTIWISDTHLGTRACQADLLLDFLRRTDCDTLYLVGDIVDGWRLKRFWYWPQSHNDIVQKILRKARKGVKVVFLPGNHDEFGRQFLGQAFGDIHVEDSVVHQTADGRRLLVMHGDQFDVVVRHARWLARLGGTAYEILLRLNTSLNLLRRSLGFTYWSLSAFLKYRTKKAVDFLGRFEAALAAEAHRQGVDGIICGHVHTAELRSIGGSTGDTLYCNDGDWVESCTALVEHYDGSLEILHWAQRPVQRPAEVKADTEWCGAAVPGSEPEPELEPGRKVA